MGLPGTEKKAPNPDQPKVVEGSPLPKSKNYPTK